ncbi:MULTISPECIES: hypothetical protein [Cocleimonas]|nr:MULTISPECIES: hypothetical protein [Cocleimonas]MEC4717205.1 hypothetical protein [Cocleimonas sp. KMM 6895]
MAAGKYKADTSTEFAGETVPYDGLLMPYHYTVNCFSWINLLNLSLIL